MRAIHYISNRSEVFVVVGNLLALTEIISKRRLLGYERFCVSWSLLLHPLRLIEGISAKSDIALYSDA